MGSEASDADPSSIPELPLLSAIPMLQSPERSGMLTPPLQTLASIPFQWEDEPGKPRPCTSLIPFPNSEPRCLELPPRLLLRRPTAKSSSPITVLEGPYVGRPHFISSSFRFFRERHGSFDSSGSRSPDDLRGPVVFGAKKFHKSRGFFGSWKRKNFKLSRTGGRKDDGSMSFVYTSSVETSSFWRDGQSINRITNVGKNGSFSSLSQARSHLWAAVYEGIKQVIPWKSKKAKKEGFI